MLEKDPKKRASATESLNHKFFGSFLDNNSEENDDDTPLFNEVKNHTSEQKTNSYQTEYVFF